jgi:hypothetical protein
VAGFIHRYFNADLFSQIIDPRSTRGRRWKTPVPLLSALMLGLAAGCKGLTEVEEMTADMPKAVRKLTGLPRRVPDTTLRDFACRVDPAQVLRMLYVVGYDAWRRKALVHDTNFPFGALSMDAKYPTLLDTHPSTFLQVHHNDAGEATHGMIRTVTASLVTAAGCPVLGATPIPAETNEQGCFAEAFGNATKIFGKLFRLVMYDAGAACEANANIVVTAGKDYLFQIANPRWIMHQTAELLTRDKAPQSVQEQPISQGKKLVRSLTVVPITQTQKSLTFWSHTKTVLKVYSETYEDGVVTGTKTRYFVSSIGHEEITASQWLALIVKRWGVETVHQILDTEFKEDDRPWISANAQGALVISLLRRVAYTLMTLYKSVTQRSDDNRRLPWRTLMGWIRDSLKWPNPEPFEELRARSFEVPPAFA